MNTKQGHISRRSALGRIGAAAALGTGLAALGAPSVAQAAGNIEKAKLKMVLDWAFQGPQAVWTAAEQNGIFKHEGLDVHVDHGAGSSDTVVKVASGAYDIGWAELSSIIQYNVKNPDNAVTAYYISNENTANSVMALKSRGINGVKDLEGKKVGATAGSAALDIFGAFTEANHIDIKKIKIVQVSSSLRETLLVHGDFDAELAAITSSVLSIEALGVKASDILSMPYGSYGVPMYGHSVFVKDSFARANPNTVAAIVRGANNALKSAIAHPTDTVKTLLKRDPLLDLKVEHKRLVDLMLKRLVLTDYILAHGLSSVQPARLQGTIDTIGKAYGIKALPKLEVVFNGMYLPPQADRMPPPLGT